MSQQIDQVVAENKESFLGKDKEIKKFLLKNFERVFKQYPLKKFERIDATDRLKKSGFQKQLSGWRNIYKNIVVTSCIVENDVKKRYDYKFYFIEERLDEKTVELIEKALNEVESLRRNFKFDEAAAKVDELLELIKSQQDPVFNKKFFDIKKEIKAEEEEYQQLNEKLKELEKNLQEQQEKNDLSSAADTCDDLVKITKTLKRNDLNQKYSKLSKELNKKLELEKEFEDLEKTYEIHLKNYDYDNAISALNKIIQLAKKNNKMEIEKEYSDVLEGLLKSLEEVKQRADTTIQEASKFAADSQFEKAIITIDKALKELQLYKYKGFADNIKRLQLEREKFVDRQKEYLKITDDLVELNKKLIESMKNNELFVALNYCARLIEIAKAGKKQEFIDKYTETLDLINKRIDALKKKIDTVIITSSDLADMFQFEQALSNMNEMLSYLGQELPDYRIKLEDKKREIIAAEAKFRALEGDIKELDKELKDNLDKRNYVAALKVCEKIVKISTPSNNKALIDKYNDKLAEIKQRMDELKLKIDETIGESFKLKQNKRFKEGLSKIDNIMALIGEQELPKEKQKLLAAKTEILEAQEDYVKFAKDMTELDNQLQNHLKNNNLMGALNSCDLLVQISESLNDPKLIDMYKKIAEEINNKLAELKRQIEKGLENIDELIKNSQFNDAMSNIDTLEKFVDEKGLPEYKAALKEKRDECLKAENANKIYQEQIRQLEKQLQQSLNKEELNSSAKQCQDLIQLTKTYRDAKLTDKYSKLLDQINIKIQDIKTKIESVLDQNFALSEDINLDKALSEMDKLLNVVEKYQIPDLILKLKERKTELLEARDLGIKPSEVEVGETKGKKPVDPCRQIVDEISVQVEIIQKNLLELKKREGGRQKEGEPQKVVVPVKPVPSTEAISQKEGINIVDGLIIEISNRYKDIRDKIDEGLKKLHIGIIHTAAMAMIDVIIKDQKENPEIKMRLTTIISEGLKKKD